VAVIVAGMYAMPGAKASLDLFKIPLEENGQAVVYFAHQPVLVFLDLFCVEPYLFVFFGNVQIHIVGVYQSEQNLV